MNDKNQVNWNDVYKELDAYYGDGIFNSIAFSFLESNYEYNKPKSCVSQKCFMDGSDKLIYHSNSRISNYGYIYSTGLNQSLSPSMFMRKFAGMTVKQQMHEALDDYMYEKLLGRKKPKSSVIYKKPNNKKIKTNTEKKIINNKKENILSIKKAVKYYNNYALKTPGVQLVNDRGIDRDVLFSNRFSNIKHGKYDIKNKPEKRFVVIPSYNESLKLSAYERIFSKDTIGDGLKKQFSKGTGKNLYFSNNVMDAQTIVICENAIDCLSHASLFKNTNYAYVATFGNPNYSAYQTLSKVIQKRKDYPNIVFAFDNDENNVGFKYAAKFAKCLPDGYRNVTQIIHRPKRLQELDNKSDDLPSIFKVNENTQKDNSVGRYVCIIPTLNGKEFNDWNDLLVEVNLQHEINNTIRKKKDVSIEHDIDNINYGSESNSLFQDEESSHSWQEYNSEINFN